MGDENNEFLEVDPDLRRLASEESAPTKECPFGKKCYRKNIQHLREYRHSKKIAPNSASATTSKMAKGTEPTKKTTIKRPLDISSSMVFRKCVIHDISHEHLNFNSQIHCQLF